MAKKSEPKQSDESPVLKSEPMGPKTLLATEVLDLEAYFASVENQKEVKARIEAEKKVAELTLELTKLKVEKAISDFNGQLSKLSQAEQAIKARYEVMLKDIRTRLNLPSDSKFGYDPSTFEVKE